MSVMTHQKLEGYMLFNVESSGYQPLSSPINQFYLVRDNWNDWWDFKTLFQLYYVNEQGTVFYIGAVKIGKFNLEPDSKIIVETVIDERFNVLPPEYFSLGQDETYYINLTKYCGEDLRYRVLKALKDVALDEELFELSLHEQVMGRSLLREVSRATVRGRYRRLAKGDASLSHYKFKYIFPQVSQDLNPELELFFEVNPDIDPPSNMHVIIGRNGVGKTYLLNNMVRSLIIPSDVGDFGLFSMDLEDKDIFANLVSVSFSAFDNTEAVREEKNNSTGMRYSYIGLREIEPLQDIVKKIQNKVVVDTDNHTTKSVQKLQNEFIESLKVCFQGAKVEQWVRAIKMLESDPVFERLEISKLPQASTEKILTDTANLLFKKLSSGHKIVLLTITKLIEKVEERTLVILDEPEGHLHPPLLSAFIRALSELLIYRNGVAIIATHSPVILQEVPRSCVWLLRRSGNIISMDRPPIETFGENLGTLTRQVFGLEVINSGFHKMILDEVKKGLEYEEILNKFSNQLGMEARALIRALVATRGQE